MNDDLIAQLRAVTGLECVEGGFRVTPTDPLSQAAASKIEHLGELLKAALGGLRAKDDQIVALRAEIERLRAALEQE